jgi:hypothetical protein
LQRMLADGLENRARRDAAQSHLEGVSGKLT